MPRKSVPFGRSALARYHRAVLLAARPDLLEATDPYAWDRCVRYLKDCGAVATSTYSADVKVPELIEMAKLLRSAGLGSADGNQRNAG